MNNSYPKAFLLSVALTGIFFCLITTLFNVLGVLSFSPQLVAAPFIAGLPLTILLVPFVISALGLLSYRFLNSNFPNNNLEKFSLSVSNLILGLCIAMLFFGYMKLFTMVTFSILFILLLYIEYKNKLRFMYRFYRTYLALVVPLYFLCLYIKTQDPILFNQNAGLKLDLVYLPIEAYFFFMGMLLMAVYLFEFFKNKALKKNG
ncbi:lycopene cyclase domain-containing protein [Pedobacter nyackensis]|uniref:lycopene cyclase domain-containing protein n=1 Tax=Pedobacter nyackensis TaxID=475255 RepID=UPI00292F6BDB|nr:lycopene cyclase domain-containing protein [Pedobacter nyackensis]